MINTGIGEAINDAQQIGRHCLNKFEILRILLSGNVSCWSKAINAVVNGIVSPRLADPTSLFMQGGKKFLFSGMLSCFFQCHNLRVIFYFIGDR